MSEQEIRAEWIVSPVVRAFESGQCDARTFAEDICSHYQLTITPDAFLEAFAAWPQGAFEGAGELLDALKIDFSLACLSNTKKLHHDAVLAPMAFLASFEHQLMSHKTGLMKPDPAAFEHALETLGVPAGEILFFDDNEANVDAALAVGIEAALVQGPAGVRSALGARGFPITSLPSS